MLSATKIRRLDGAAAKRQLDTFAADAEAADVQWLHVDAVSSLRAVGESMLHYGSGRRGLPEQAIRDGAAADGGGARMNAPVTPAHRPLQSVHKS